MTAEWRDEAVCLSVDPELFFPEVGRWTAIPKRVCKQCPVRTECLDDAIATHERYGVRGGMSERERRPLHRRRNRNQ